MVIDHFLTKIAVCKLESIWLDLLFYMFDYIRRCKFTSSFSDFDNSSCPVDQRIRIYRISEAHLLLGCIYMGPSCRFHLDGSICFYLSKMFHLVEFIFNLSHSTCFWAGAFYLLLGPPGFICWFSFALVFQWCCSPSQ